MNVSISLAGCGLMLELRYPEAARYFSRFSMSQEQADLPPVSVSELAFSDWASAGNAIDGFAEFCLACQPCSEALMESDRCVFHAAALRYRDRAFLLAARSGEGKSTHLRRLLEREAEGYSVINGDKPVLELRDGACWVHPSPWTGKEGYHGAASARLGGIFFVFRDQEDLVRPMTEKEASFFAYPNVFQSFRDETVIRRAGAFTEKLLKSAPSYLFKTNDIEASSALLHEAIKEAASHDL